MPVVGWHPLLHLPLSSSSALPLPDVDLMYACDGWPLPFLPLPSLLPVDRPRTLPLPVHLCDSLPPRVFLPVGLPFFFLFDFSSASASAFAC